jgi:hypothetical protein
MKHRLTSGTSSYSQEHHEQIASFAQNDSNTHTDIKYHTSRASGFAQNDSNTHTDIKFCSK